MGESRQSANRQWIITIISITLAVLELIVLIIGSIAVPIYLNHEKSEITVQFQGENMITEKAYLEAVDANAQLMIKNGRLQDEINRLQTEINNSQTPEDIVIPNNDVLPIAEVWLRNGKNVSGCPQIDFTDETLAVDSFTYDMTWNPFDGASMYRILIWRDSGYGTIKSNYEDVDDLFVNGLSYTIDLNQLEHGYTYGFNVVVDNHYSAPLLVKLC